MMLLAVSIFFPSSFVLFFLGYLFNIIHILTDLHSIYLNSKGNQWKYNFRICFSVWMYACCHGLSGHFRIQRLVTRTSLAIRTGCQDHRVHSRVIRTKKTAVRTFFFCVSAKNAKQTNTFVGFCEYVSIPIRLYTEIECHI